MIALGHTLYIIIREIATSLISGSTIVAEELYDKMEQPDDYT